jgi:hypothetical protein
MRPAEIQVKINIAQREADFWRGILADKRCGNCEHYKDDICSQYQAEPPGKAQEPGCDEWSWDSIPF